VPPDRRREARARQQARRRLTALVGAGLLAFACGIAVGSGAGGDGSASAPVAPATPAEVKTELSPSKQIGQLLISRFEGTRPPAYILQRLRARQTAGVILFGDNVGRGQAVEHLTAALQRAAGGGALIATDDEGGTIMNVPIGGVVPAQPDVTGSVAEVARRLGRGLRERGVNVDLAPVGDLPVPGSVMTGRAFTGAPHEVAAKTGEAVRGYGEVKVAAAVKHFPGMGGALQNTDDAGVTIAAARTELEDDLLPFRAAIDQGVPLVMASHAVYPSLDRRNIASQSSAILERLLRQGLGYQGAIVTDSIEAQAVLDRSSVETAAERSINAGADLILMTGRGSWIRIYPRLLARFRRDPAFRERVAEAVTRVLRLKRRIGLSASL
jgi:beta-N-acetylhexosaminidase